MKILKRIVLVLFILIALPLIIALFVPKEFHSEGSVVINKPKQEVFDYIKYVKNQDNFGTWQLSDPDMETTSEGTDGTVGFKYSWNSEKLGKGAQEITNIVEGERMESNMYFLDFNDDANKSYISVEEQDGNQTLVKWGIEGKTPYPWNIMSLFYNMDSSFDEGLNNLKEILENPENQSNEKAFLINYFRETQDNLYKIVADLSKEQLHFKPSEESWSISQCLEHIIVTEDMIFSMVKENMKKPVNPEMRSKLIYSDKQIMEMAVDRTEKYSAPEILVKDGKFDDSATALNELSNQRKEIYGLVENTAIDELRNRVNESPSGFSDAYQSILFIAAHTARHTLQIEEIKANPDFPQE